MFRRSVYLTNRCSHSRRMHESSTGLSHDCLFVEFIASEKRKNAEKNDFLLTFLNILVYYEMLKGKSSMANDETKELADLSEVFKALGHPTRLWIAKHLEGRELCVCDFVAGTNEEFSSISQHLNVLKKAHVVECDKRGKHVFYRLAYPCIPWMIRFMEARDGYRRLSPEEQARGLEQQRQKLIDYLKHQKV